MSNIITAVEFSRRGANTRRYHTFPTLIIETVGHHSHGVASLIAILHPDCSAALLIAALRHDAAEHVIGDIPAPSKRTIEGLKKTLDDLEDRTSAEAGIPMPALTTTEQRQLKFADNAQGALYCLEELKRGNQIMMEPLMNYIRYLSTTQAAEGWTSYSEEDILTYLKHQASYFNTEGRNVGR